MADIKSPKSYLAIDYNLAAVTELQRTEVEEQLFNGLKKQTELVESLRATSAYLADMPKGNIKSSNFSSYMQTALANPDKYLREGATSEDVADNKSAAFVNVLLAKVSEKAAQAHSQYLGMGKTIEEANKLAMAHVRDDLEGLTTSDKNKNSQAKKLNDLAMSMSQIYDGKVFTDVSGSMRPEFAIKAKDFDQNKNIINTTENLFQTMGYVSKIDADTEVTWGEKVGGQLADSTIAGSLLTINDKWAANFGSGEDAIYNDPTVYGWAYTGLGIAGAIGETIGIAKLSAGIFKAPSVNFIPRFTPMLATVVRGAAGSLAEQQMGYSRIYWDSDNPDPYQYEHTNALYNTMVVDAMTFSMGMGTSGALEQWFKKDALKSILNTGITTKLASLPFKMLAWDSLFDSAIDFATHNITSDIIEYTQQQEQALGLTGDFGDMAYKFLTNVANRAGARIAKGLISNAYTETLGKKFDAKGYADMMSNDFINRVGNEDHWSRTQKNMARLGNSLYPTSFEGVDKNLAIYTNEDLLTLLKGTTSQFKNLSLDKKLDFLGGQILLNEANSNYMVWAFNGLRRLPDPSFKVDGKSPAGALEIALKNAGVLSKTKVFLGQSGKDATADLAKELYAGFKNDLSDDTKQESAVKLFRAVIDSVNMDDVSTDSFKTALRNAAFEDTDPRKAIALIEQDPALSEADKRSRIDALNKIQKRAIASVEGLLTDKTKARVTVEDAIQTKANRIVNAVMTKYRDSMREAFKQRQGHYLPIDNEEDFNKVIDMINKQVDIKPDMNIYHKFMNMVDSSWDKASDIRTEYRKEFTRVFKNYKSKSHTGSPTDQFELRLNTIDELRVTGKRAAQTLVEKKINSMYDLYKNVKQSRADSKTDLTNIRNLTAKAVSDIAFMHATFADVMPGIINRLSKLIADDKDFGQFINRSLEGSPLYMKNLEPLLKAKASDNEQEGSVILRLIASMNTASFAKIESLHNFYNASRKSNSASAITSLMEIAEFIKQGGIANAEAFSRLMKRSGVSFAIGRDNIIQVSDNNTDVAGVGIKEYEMANANLLIQHMIFSGKDLKSKPTKMVALEQALSTLTDDMRVIAYEKALQLAFTKMLLIDDDDNPNAKIWVQETAGALREAGLLTSTGEITVDVNSDRVLLRNFSIDKTKISQLIESDTVDAKTRTDVLTDIMVDRIADAFRAQAGAISIFKDSPDEAFNLKEDSRYVMSVGVGDKQESLTPKEIFEKHFVDNAFKYGSNINVMLTQLAKASLDLPSFKKYVEEVLVRSNTRIFNTMETEEKNFLVDYAAKHFLSMQHLELSLTDDLKDIITTGFVEPNAMYISEINGFMALHVSKEAEQTKFDLDDTQLLNKLGVIRMAETGVNATTDYVVVKGSTNRERLIYLLKGIKNMQEIMRGTLNGFDEVDAAGNVIKTVDNLSDTEKFKAFEETSTMIDDTITNLRNDATLKGDMDESKFIKTVQSVFNKVMTHQRQVYKDIIARYGDTYKFGEGEADNMKVKFSFYDDPTVMNRYDNALTGIDMALTGGALSGLIAPARLLKLLSANEISKNDGGAYTKEDMKVILPNVLDAIDTYIKYVGEPPLAGTAEKGEYDAAIKTYNDFIKDFGTASITKELTDVPTGNKAAIIASLDAQKLLIGATTPILTDVSISDQGKVLLSNFTDEFGSTTTLGSVLAKIREKLTPSDSGDVKAETDKTSLYKLEEDIDTIRIAFEKFTTRLADAAIELRTNVRYKILGDVQEKMAELTTFGTEKFNVEELPENGVRKQRFQGIVDVEKHLTKLLENPSETMFGTFTDALKTGYNYLGFGGFIFNGPLLQHKRLGMLSLMGSRFQTDDDIELLLRERGQNSKLNVVVLGEQELNGRPIDDGLCIMPRFLMKFFGEKHIALQGSKQAYLAGNGAIKLNFRSYADDQSAYTKLLGDIYNETGKVLDPDNTIILSNSAWKEIDPMLEALIHKKSNLYEGRDKVVQEGRHSRYGNYMVLGNNSEGDDFGNKFAKHIVTNTYRHSSPTPHAGKINYPGQAAIMDMQMRYVLNTGMNQAFERMRNALNSIDLDTEGSVTSFVDKIKSTIGIPFKMQGAYLPLTGMQKNFTREEIKSLEVSMRDTQDKIDQKVNLTNTLQEVLRESKETLHKEIYSYMGVERKLEQFSEDKERRYEKQIVRLEQEIAQLEGIASGKHDDYAKMVHNEAIRNGRRLLSALIDNNDDEQLKALDKLIVDIQKVALGFYHPRSTESKINFLRDKQNVLYDDMANDVEALQSLRDDIADKRTTLREYMNGDSMEDTMISYHAVDARDLSDKRAEQRTKMRKLLSGAHYQFFDDVFKADYTLKDGTARSVTGTALYGDISLLEDLASRSNLEFSSGRAEFAGFHKAEIQETISRMKRAFSRGNHATAQDIDTAFRFLSAEGGEGQMFKAININNKKAYVMLVGRTPFIHNGSMHPTLITGVDRGLRGVSLGMYDQIMQNADFDGDNGMHFGVIKGSSVIEQYKLLLSEDEVRSVTNNMPEGTDVEVELINRLANKALRMKATFDRASSQFKFGDTGKKDIMHGSQLDHTLDSGQLIASMMKAAEFYSAAGAAKSYVLGGKRDTSDDMLKNMYSKIFNFPLGKTTDSAFESKFKQIVYDKASDTHKDKFALFKEFSNFNEIKDSFFGSFSNIGLSSRTVSVDGRDRVVVVANTRTSSGDPSTVLMLCSSAQNIPGLRIDAVTTVDNSKSMDLDFLADAMRNKILTETSSNNQGIHNIISSVSGTPGDFANKIKTSSMYGDYKLLMANVEMMHYIVQQSSVDSPANHGLYAFMNHWRNKGVLERGAESIIDEMVKMTVASRFHNVSFTEHSVDNTPVVRNDAFAGTSDVEYTKAINASFRDGGLAAHTVSAVAFRMQGGDSSFIGRQEFDTLMAYNQDGRVSFDSLVKLRNQTKMISSADVLRYFDPNNSDISHKRALMYMPSRLIRSITTIQALEEMTAKFDDNFFNKYGLDRMQYINPNGTFKEFEDKQKGIPKIISLVKMISAIERTKDMFDIDGTLDARKAMEIFSTNAGRFAQSTEVRDLDEFIDRIVHTATHTNPRAGLTKNVVKSTLEDVLGLTMVEDMDFSARDAMSYILNNIDLDKNVIPTDKDYKKLNKDIAKNRLASGESRAKVIKFVDKNSSDKDFLSTMELAMKLENKANELDDAISKMNFGSRAVAAEQRKNIKNIIDSLFRVTDGSTRTVLGLRALGMSTGAARAVKVDEFGVMKIDDAGIQDFASSKYYVSSVYDTIAKESEQTKVNLQSGSDGCITG